MTDKKPDELARIRSEIGRLLLKPPAAELIATINSASEFKARASDAKKAANSANAKLDRLQSAYNELAAFYR